MADPSANPSDPVDLVRRRLLVQGGRYAVPAVLATFLMGQTAYAQGSSAAPPKGGLPPGQGGSPPGMM